MRILLVENDADQLRWLRDKLSKLGHEVICTMDGDTSFASWQIQRPFDFVVTSQLFHGRRIKSGLELIAAIRAVDPLQAFVMETQDENLVPPFAVPSAGQTFSVSPTVPTAGTLGASKTAADLGEQKWESGRHNSACE